MILPVKLAPEVYDDLRQLSSARLQQVALGWLTRLEREPDMGKRLEWRLNQDLGNCRKVYFDEGDQPLRLLAKQPKRPGGPRFRIVYELLPIDDRPNRVFVWAVGAKRDPSGGVYDAAHGRRSS